MQMRSSASCYEVVKRAVRALLAWAVYMFVPLRSASGFKLTLRMYSAIDDMCSVFFLLLVVAFAPKTRGPIQ